MRMLHASRRVAVYLDDNGAVNMAGAATMLDWEQIRDVLDGLIEDQRRREFEAGLHTDERQLELDYPGG